MFVNVSRIAPIWPRTATAAPRGGAPARAIAASTWPTVRPRSWPATFAVSVTIRWPLMRSYSPTIVAFSIVATSPSSACEPVIAAHRHDAQIVERGHPRLRDLDLHLERDAGARVGPVVRRDEPAGRGRGGKRSADLIDRDAELAGHLAVHIDLDRRVVERLAVLQIAERGNARELVPDLGRKRPAGREIRSR